MTNDAIATRCTAATTRQPMTRGRKDGWTVVRRRRRRRLFAHVVVICISPPLCPLCLSLIVVIEPSKWNMQEEKKEESQEEKKEEKSRTAIFKINEMRTTRCGAAGGHYINTISIPLSSSSSSSSSSCVVFAQYLPAPSSSTLRHIYSTALDCKQHFPPPSHFFVSFFKIRRRRRRRLHLARLTGAVQSVVPLCTAAAAPNLE